MRSWGTRTQDKQAALPVPAMPHERGAPGPAPHRPRSTILGRPSAAYNRGATEGGLAGSGRDAEVLGLPDSLYGLRGPFDPRGWNDALPSVITLGAASMRRPALSSTESLFLLSDRLGGRGWTRGARRRPRERSRRRRGARQAQFPRDASLLLILILVAGNETTTNLIGNAVHTRPRVATRVATRDTELAGTRIQEGEHLMVLFASANRDSRKYANGDAFELRRNPKEHVAFGSGIRPRVAA